MTTETIVKIIISLSLCFNGHSPGEPAWVSRCLLEQSMVEVVVVRRSALDTEAPLKRTEKLLPNGRIVRSCWILDANGVDVSAADADSVHCSRRCRGEVEHPGCDVHRQRRHVAVHCHQRLVRVHAHRVRYHLQHVVLRRQQNARLLPRVCSHKHSTFSTIDIVLLIGKTTGRLFPLLMEAVVTAV